MNEQDEKKWFKQFIIQTVQSAQRMNLGKDYMAYTIADMIMSRVDVLIERIWKEETKK